MKISKNIEKQQKELSDLNKVYDLEEAISLLKNLAFEKFDTSFRASFNLNIDPKQSTQQLRGTIILPSGTGKEVKILAIVDVEDEEKAKKAGANYVGGENLLEKIKNENWFDFDLIVTTPKLMPKFSKYGKLLGTKGLMPNPKLGTITSKIDKTIEDFKKGAIEYKTDAGGNVNVLFGKKSFSNQDLTKNFNEILSIIKNVKPPGVKGEYIKNICISTTMSKSLKINYKN